MERPQVESAMNLLFRLFAKRPDPRLALEPLWQAVVAEGRNPRWYADCGVEDSVTGRFDMISMVTALVSLRMEKSPSLGEANVLLTECFVEDMEGQLREFGVNDVVVGKRMGKLVGSLGGRLGALRDSLPLGEDAVSEVAARNIRLGEGGSPAMLGRELVALAARLAALDDRSLMAGKLDKRGAV